MTRRLVSHCICCGFTAERHPEGMIAKMKSLNGSEPKERLAFTGGILRIFTASMLDSRPTSSRISQNVTIRRSSSRRPGLNPTTMYKRHRPRPSAQFTMWSTWSVMTSQSGLETAVKSTLKEATHSTREGENMEAPWPAKWRRDGNSPRVEECAWFDDESRVLFDDPSTSRTRVRAQRQSPFKSDLRQWQI